MPLASYRAPFDQFIGKVGGGPNAVVTYANDGRGLARSHAIPSDPKTSQQRAVRSAVAALGTRFTAFTPAEAAAWDAFGAHFVRRDRLNREYALSGLNAYIASGSARLLSLPPEEHDPWPVPVAPPDYASLPAPYSLSITANAGGTALNVTAGHLLPAGALLRFRITPPIASANAKARVGSLRLISAVLSDSYVVSVGPGNLQLAVSAPAIAGIIPGAVIGLEAQAYTADFCPGQIQFERRITVTLTP